MRPVMAYRNGRPNGQATVPVYLETIQEYGWEAVHRQTLTELADWLTRDRQNLSPMQIAEYADQWQQPLLIAVQNGCAPEVQPTMAMVEALFCQIFGAASHALVARKHSEKRMQAVQRAEAIVARLQSEHPPRP
jgi:uncharacterized protein YfdQ (DUF2303 family)